MSKLKLEIILPTGKKLDIFVDSVIIPGIDGDFQVTPGHTPFLTKIRPGVMKVIENNDTSKYAIHDGFVTVDADTIKIVSEVFEDSKSIDLERAKAALDRAEKRLKDTTSDKVDFRRAEFALKRAVARLDVLSKAE